MAGVTQIEWTEKTWNPTTGCTKVSPGCKNCYAERITNRFPNKFPNGFNLTEHWDRLQVPRKWRKPSMIFVDSMSDLFHEDIPLNFIDKVFGIICSCPRHTFQILTKRSRRLADLAVFLPWPRNLWMGVSIENQDYAYRIEELRTIPAHVKFLSCEPLLGPLDLNLEGIHWVIVGGESGPKHRLMNPNWVRNIRNQCTNAGVPFFFKQWGGVTPKANGRQLDGRTHDAMPARKNA